MFAGWMHKASTPWPKEVLDRVCALIPELFDKFNNGRLRKPQLLELVQDEVINKLRLEKDPAYEMHDHSYMRRLIYGKTQELIKQQAVRASSEEEDASGK